MFGDITNLLPLIKVIVDLGAAAAVIFVVIIFVRLLDRVEKRHQALVENHMHSCQEVLNRNTNAIMEISKDLRDLIKTRTCLLLNEDNK